MSLGAKRSLSREEARALQRLKFKGPGRTKQAMKDECDINTIFRRYVKSGILPPDRGLPVFGEAPAVDFREACQLVLDGQAAFERLPSKVRGEFDNDPRLFMEFMADASNRDKAIELGLVEKPPAVSSPPPASGPGGTPGGT